MEVSAVKNRGLKIFLIVSVICGYEFLSFFPDLLDIENRTISVTFRILVGLVCLIIILKEKMQINRNVNFLFLFMFLYVFRFLYETVVNGHLIVLPILDYWGYLILGSILPMLALLTKIDDKVLSKSLKIMFVILLFINIMGLMNNQEYVLDAHGEERVRADANSGLNTITFANMALNLILASLLIMTKSRYKLFFLIPIGIAVVNMGIAGSRGPILQLVLIAFFFWYKNHEKIKLKFVIPILISLTGIIYYFSTKYDAFKMLTARFTESQTNEGGSDYSRFMYLKGGWEQFLNSPFVGDSVEVKPYGVYPHNMLVESFMSLGILGGILCIVILYVTFKKALLLLKKEEIIWLVLIFLSNLIVTFTSGSIVNNFKFWNLAAIILTYQSTKYIVRNESSNTN